MRNKIIELYQAGYSQKEICNQLDTQFYQVNKVLKESGFDTKIYRKIPDYLKDLICFMIKEGYSQKNISEILDISIHVVRQVSRENDLQGVAHSKRLSDNKAAIVGLYQEGKTVTDISKLLRADKSRIKNILIEAGVYNFPAVKDQQILNSYIEGKPYPEIVKEHKTGYRRIKRIISQQ